MIFLDRFYKHCDFKSGVIAKAVRDGTGLLGFKIEDVVAEVSYTSASGARRSEYDLKITDLYNITSFRGEIDGLSARMRNDSNSASVNIMATPDLIRVRVTTSHEGSALSFIDTFATELGLEAIEDPAVTLRRSVARLSDHSIKLSKSKDSLSLTEVVERLERVEARLKRLEDHA